MQGQTAKPPVGRYFRSLSAGARHNSSQEKKKSYNITYKKSNGRTVKRKIDPFSIKGDLVVAWDHKRQATRSFKKDRILKMEKSAFWSGFEKQAAVRLSDVEGSLGGYLVDRKARADVEGRMGVLNKERLGLKHPWLTGIPTLGLWPSISRENAAGELADVVRRDHNPVYAGIRSEVHEREALEHQRMKELEALHIANRQADMKEALMSTGSTAALAGLGMYVNRNKDEQ